MEAGLPRGGTFPAGTHLTQRRLNSLMEAGLPRGGTFPAETHLTQRRLNSLMEAHSTLEHR